MLLSPQLNPSAGLYPTDILQRLRVDEMLGIVTDVRGKIVPTMRMSDEAEKAAARKVGTYSTVRSETLRVD